MKTMVPINKKCGDRVTLRDTTPSTIYKHETLSLNDILCEEILGVVVLHIVGAAEIEVSQAAIAEM